MMIMMMIFVKSNDCMITVSCEKSIVICDCEKALLTADFWYNVTFDMIQSMSMV